MSECGEWVFEFPLSIELHSQFGKNHCIIADRPFVGPMLNLRAGPFRPVRIFRKNIGDDAGVHEDHAYPRVSRSQSSVRALIFPPRSNALKTRLPRDKLAALTTNTPSG